MKFGISFTATFFNQAGALVLIYRDGSVQVNHGGTEMGQGLHTKIRQIAAESLGVPTRSHPRHAHAHRQGAQHVGHRGLGGHGSERRGGARRLPPVERAVSRPLLPRCPEIPFAQVVEAAYRQRIPLFAQGYYRTPGIHFDPTTGTRQAVPLFRLRRGGVRSRNRWLHRRYTACCASTFWKTSATSFSPLIDRGQIEGGFMQGLGWLTIEELLWDAQGRLWRPPAHPLTSCLRGRRCRKSFNVDFLERAAEPGVVFGSKAVGEPPLMLAISVREAIRDAIAAFGNGGLVTLDSPATPERVFFGRPARCARALRDGVASTVGGRAVVTAAAHPEILRATLFPRAAQSLP